MAIDYELADYSFSETDAPTIAGALMMKVTTETEEIPQDYSGVKSKKKTVENIPIPPLMGPAPMRMAVIPPGLGLSTPPAGMGMSQPMNPAMAQPGGGSLGMQAVQDVMQFA